MRFEGKRVVQTGGASGIGRATVLRFAQEGATVFAIDRSAEGLAETARAAAEFPGRVIAHEADLSTEEGVVAAASAAVAELGEVDVLVNGAGAMSPSPLQSSDRAGFQRLLDVNFLAPVTMCREILPHMPDATSAIVNVTSTSATHAHPGMTGYAASKGALLAFSISLAAELKSRRIRVVPVSPGGIATPLTDAVATTEGVDFDYYMRIFPLWGEMGRPEDIAAAIAFAASHEAAYLNGAEMRVDGLSHA